MCVVSMDEASNLFRACILPRRYILSTATRPFKMRNAENLVRMRQK